MATAVESVLGTNIAALILSWILVFAVTYASLLKSKALGEDLRVMGVVSLVVAFFAVGVGAALLGRFFQSLFFSMALVIGGLLVAILFLAMSGADVAKFLGNSKISAVLALVAVVIFLQASGIGRAIGGDLASTILVLGVLGIAVVFITGK